MENVDEMIIRIRELNDEIIEVNHVLANISNINNITMLEKVQLLIDTRDRITDLKLQLNQFKNELDQLIIQNELH